MTLSDGIPKPVMVRTIDDGQGNKTYVEVNFHCEEGLDISDIHNWTATLTVDNTTQVIPLNVFLLMCEGLKDVYQSAQDSGLI